MKQMSLVLPTTTIFNSLPLYQLQHYLIPFLCNWAVAVLGISNLAFCLELRTFKDLRHSKNIFVDTTGITVGKERI
jgi:hypothetical protein